MLGLTWDQWLTVAKALVAIGGAVVTLLPIIASLT